MSDNESFFRKVVRFVANPATEWSELGSRQDDGRELELERSELKAMIERKRRNDFVRKREFDMLRKVRREGLSPEQLAALGSSSRLDDSEARAPEGAPAGQAGVKAKIDAIEQQMVGSGGGGQGRPSRPGVPYDAAPAVVPSRRDRLGSVDAPVSTGAGAFRASASGGLPKSEGVRSIASGSGRTAPPPDFMHSRPQQPVDIPLPVLQRGVDPPASGFDWPPVAAGVADAPAPRAGQTPELNLPPLWNPSAPDRAPVAVPAPLPPLLPLPAASPVSAQMGTGLPPLAPLSAVAFDAPGPGSRARSTGAFVNPFEVQVSEVVHDPELDEAVIAFANADFGPCEESLRRLMAPGGVRAQHAETWLVLFDLYRATGQQQRFETLALDYAQQFGWSAPQWYSLPQLVADGARDEEPAVLRNLGPTTAAAPGVGVGWVCPPQLDTEAVSRLRAQTLQMPLPWVLDWSGLNRVDAEAAMQLSSLFRLWAGQPVEMRWVDGQRLPAVLQETAPTGSRNADPVYWLARLEGLRLINRADRFDEVAIDYCLTYEVSPPSWEPARCRVTLVDDAGASAGGPWSGISDVSTGFLESSLVDDGSGVEVARVELSGQLAGDIGATLERIRHKLAQASLVQVSCARLIRVDFIAAGDLLNWVLSRTAEQRAVQFVDAHRLVALFFGAMGINEHARVQVRKV